MPSQKLRPGQKLAPGVIRVNAVHVRSLLTFLSKLEFPTIINWTGAFWFSGLLASTFHFLFIKRKHV